MSSPVEQIKERLDIVEFIRSYVKLEKAGVNFKARCPFHSEKTPSFFVTPSRQIWHCFGCGKGGDHFQFIQELEGVEFPEALRILADRAGVELKKEDPRIRSERTRLLSLLEDATAFYENNLMKRKDACEYLKERGLAGVTAKQFRLGYAERGWDNLFNHLKGKGYRGEEMEKAGLVIKKDNGSFYDRFRARIMFPLFDSSARIVGFSGRIFDKDAEGQKDADSKYINTPQTILYDKSKMLYGFHRAKESIRNKNAVILVEGQMDVLLAHQAGTEYTVGVSGTAFSAMHASFLRRLAETLLIAFDRDSAGFRASERAILEGFAQGFDVKAISLPQGKDPADVICGSPDAWKGAVEGSRSVIAFLMDVVENTTKDQREKLHGMRSHVLPYVARIVSDMEKAHWIRTIAMRLAIAEDAVWKEMQNISKEQQRSAVHFDAERKYIPQSRKDIIEERLLGVLAWKRKEGAGLYSACKEEWWSDARKALFTSLKSNDRAENHYIKKLALEAELVYGDSEQIEDEGKNLSEELRKEYVRESLQALVSDIRRAETEGQKDIIAEKMEKLKELSRELHN